MLMLMMSLPLREDLTLYSRARTHTHANRSQVSDARVPISRCEASHSGLAELFVALWLLYSGARANPFGYKPQTTNCASRKRLPTHIHTHT